MPRKIVLDLDEPIALMLAEAVQEINESCQSDWTVETLAVSFLEHMLTDDICNCGQTIH